MKREVVALGVGVGLLAGCANVQSVEGDRRDEVVEGLHAAGYDTVGTVQKNNYNWGDDDYSGQITIGSCLAKVVVVVPVNDHWVPATPDFTSGGNNKHIPEASPETFKADYGC